MENRGRKREDAGGGIWERRGCEWRETIRIRVRR
jgi:hypothetical protein